MLVAAELARLGYEVLLGNVGSHNTKGIDMTASCPLTGHAASISVKSLKGPNAFLIDPKKILSKAVYVFVITGIAGQLPQFFVIRGADLLKEEDRYFGKWGRRYEPKHGRGIVHKMLHAHANDWAVLDGA
jgi:hypothetical protein